MRCCNQFFLDIFGIIVYKYIYMKNIVNIFKLLSDETRVRLLMLLTRKELCVCQLMGVLGISQPLVSRNLSLLNRAGFLDERRDGKLIFYSIRKDITPVIERTIDLLLTELRSSTMLQSDLESLTDCAEFQKKTGKCDMKTFLAFMEKKRKREGKGRK